MRFATLIFFMMAVLASFAEERGFLARLFSSEPQSQAEKLLEAYTDNRSEILKSEIYSIEGFLFFAYQEELAKDQFDDLDLDWRLNSDGMLAVSDLMDSLVSEACGKTADKIDLPQASVPEQGISNDSFVYVLATPKAEFDRQIEKVCAR